MTTHSDGLEIKTFVDADSFERWLTANHETEPGLWLKIAKKANPEPSISYDESVEVALCLGWIDGIRKGHDDLWFVQRFTPRRKRSIWSKKNVDRVEALIAAGRMQEAGLREVEAAQADGRWERAYPGSAEADVPDDLKRALEASAKAATAFEALSQSARYSILFRLHNAVRPETRQRRILETIESLEAGSSPSS
jgi:uncharacterized protein YdeI (YjbR/CyaY-like superfamily)